MRTKIGLIWNEASGGYRKFILNKPLNTKDTKEEEYFILTQFVGILGEEE